MPTTDRPATDRPATDRPLAPGAPHDPGAVPTPPTGTPLADAPMQTLPATDPAARPARPAGPSPHDGTSPGGAARHGLRARGPVVLPVLVASVLSAALAAGATVALDDDPAPAATSPTAPTALPAASGAPAGADAAARAASRVAPAVVQIDTGTGVGSGVVIDDDGTVLTVAHVVGDARTVSVRLADGRTVEGRVAGTHEATDVAVVTVPAADVPAVAELATGTPEVGQLAVAVGSPFGFDQTVTAGIVSAVDRVVNGVSMVQTDAAINPGNSGGPLVDADGRVLGLSDVIFTRSGGSQGVGFAISIDLARLVADQLVAGEEVRLALLGVSTTATVDGAAGARVVEVLPGSAADAGGLEVGDVVVAVDGSPVADGGRLRARIVTAAPGRTVTVSVERAGERVDLTVTLGATGA